MMSRILFAVASLVAAVCLLCSPSLAQTTTDTALTIPFGDWVQQVAALLASLTAVFVAALMRQIPAQYAAMAKAARIDQVLERAIDYAINSVAGAAKDKALTIDVGNRVVKEALDYAIRHAPGALVDWAGGSDGIREKIIARITVAQSASIT